jgi:GT2 family glycosyltransferase
VATVVVPTFRRPAALERCLASLDAQTVRGSLEIVVVHDGPALATERPHGAAMVETRERRGPASARNAGVRTASTPLVLFIDDDCVAATDWAEHMIAGLDDGAQVVVGATSSDADRFARASQVILDTLMVPEPNGSLAFAPTMNLGCRTELLESIPFDESFSDAAGEDRAWCLRVREGGIPIVPVPLAHVDHRPHLTFRRFVRQHVRYGRGSLIFRRRYRQELASPSFYLDVVRHGFAAGPIVGTLVLVAQAATAAGVVRERLAPSRKS